MKIFVASLLAAAFACASASADTHPDSHAPIGVMGDHTHKRGELMFSYRYMSMSMEGNLDGSDNVSPEEIVTTASNPFANPPPSMQQMPPNLRVVPVDMTMDMHMFGLMYAPTDRVTLMAMAQYLDKEMDHITFAGPMGTTRLGEFTTRTKGLGDTSVAALISLGEHSHTRWHATVGLSLPTGSIDETDDILTPMNTRPTVRLPYPMQLGSGTTDLIAGLTYASGHERIGWGAQWRSVVRLGENDEDYSLGDEHTLKSWVSYRLHPSVSASARLTYLDRGNIDGMDPRIMAPVQTADPDRHGAERLDLGAGLNVLLPGHRHRLALEVSAPVSQRLDGPQMETDLVVTLGWQYAP